MSEQLAQAVMERQMIGEPAPQSAGLMDGVYNFLRNHPTAAKLAVGIGMLGAGGAAELALANTAAADVAPQPTVTMVSQGLDVSAFDVASKKIVIGQSENIRIDQRTANQCIETKPGQTWTNSVTLPNGSKYFYTETTPAKLCRDKYSPTGWVKRGGGESGLDCKNEASPKVLPKAHENVEVINVRKLNTAFTLIAKVGPLNGSVECPGVQASGSVFGEVKQRFNLRDYLRMKGNGQVNIDFRLADQAKVKAGLNIHCESTTTTTPPTPPTPTPKPPVHGCEVSNIIEKDGRTDNLTVTTDSGATTPTQETIAWGDGQTSTYAGVAPMQTEYHFYNQDATFTETVTETFADGGTATCTGVVTTQQESAPPPPPA